MKAIVIAAGSGERISKEYDNVPKALIEIHGITLLDKQISIFKKCGINEIIVIRGPNKEKFNNTEVLYVDDVKFEEHDILGSLMEAKNHIHDDVIITYSDIIFDERILKSVITKNADIGIAIRDDWKIAYKNRKLHLTSEAENVVYNENSVSLIKKNITNSTNNVGEFLGILKLSKIGSHEFVKQYDNLLNHTGKFHDSVSLKNAYLTDMIQELVEKGISVKPILVDGIWYEVDTIEDLLHVKQEIKQ